MGIRDEWWVPQSNGGIGDRWWGGGVGEGWWASEPSGSRSAPESNGGSAVKWWDVFFWAKDLSQLLCRTVSAEAGSYRDPGPQKVRKSTCIYCVISGFSIKKDPENAVLANIPIGMWISTLSVEICRCIASYCILRVLSAWDFLVE